jgi:hypothetical protein
VRWLGLHGRVQTADSEGAVGATNAFCGLLLEAEVLCRQRLGTLVCGLALLPRDRSFEAGAAPEAAVSALIGQG